MTAKFQQEIHRENGALTLLTAIAIGDASIEDLTASLQADGIDSVEAVLSILQRGINEAKAADADSLQHLGPPRLLQTPKELVSSTVHRVPEVPFLLNGTTYDPHDITRFNGQLLHFVAAANGDTLLALDDGEMIERWWQFAYLERLRESNRTSNGSPAVAQPRALGSTFYQHINYDGYSRWLNLNRGYKRLSLLNIGPFGEYGDWNDQISSVWLSGAYVLALYEHKYYAGSTYSVISPVGGPGGYGEPNLHRYGWGDRASSIGTW